MQTLQDKIDNAYGLGQYIVEPKTVRGSKDKIMITCPQHGWFITTPDNLVYNAGCKKCRGVNGRGYPIKKRQNGTAQLGRPRSVYALFIEASNSNGLTAGVASPAPARPCLYVKEFTDRKACYAALNLVRKAFTLRREDLQDIAALVDMIPAAPRGHASSH